MPKKTTLRGQFLRTVLLMLACSLLVGLAVIVVVMIAFVKKVPDGEQFLMDSVSFLFGKEVLGPNGMIHVVVLAAIALCLLVVLVCVLLASRYTSRVAAALREFRRAADDLRSGELDFQILTYPERELDELAQALESVRQRLKATAAAEAAAQEEGGLLHGEPLPRPAHAHHGHQELCGGDPGRHRRHAGEAAALSGHCVQQNHGHGKARAEHVRLFRV